MLANGILDLIADKDLRLMRRVHDWRTPRWVLRWMVFSTRAGDGWLWYFVAFVILLYGGRLRYLSITAAALGAVASILTFQLLKKRIGRRRPCAMGLHKWVALLPPDQFSFPSGHTMTAFAVSVPLICYYPAFLAALLLCALCIAASRVILGMHFLSDVVAGAVIGGLLGYLGYALVCIDGIRR